MSKRHGDPGYAPGWCIHYRSPSHHKTCEAGVAFESIEKIAFNRRPCFASNAEFEACNNRRLPTSEEIVAHKEWLRGCLDKLGGVMTAIAPWRQKYKGRSHSEIVECPACKGRLHLSIAARNGHVHGRCETQGCVSWME